MRALRDFLAKGSLVVSGMVISLLVVEVFLRSIHYNYSPLRIEVINKSSEWRYYHAFEDKQFVYDPFLIWRPRKGGLPPLAATFNEQGYRGKEIPVVKKPRSFRIFAVGDSNIGRYRSEDLLPG